MNEPVTFAKADIGRLIEFPVDGDEDDGFDDGGGGGVRGDRWLGQAGRDGQGACDGAGPGMLDTRWAARFSRHAQSSLGLRLGRREDMSGAAGRDFDVSLEMRTYDQDGLLFAAIVSGRTYL